MLSRIKYFTVFAVIAVYLFAHAFVLHIFIQIPLYFVIKLNPLVNNKSIYYNLNQQCLVAWGQVSVLLIQIFTPMEFILSGNPYFPQENAIVICNHLTYTDWLWLWMIAHLNNRLGGVKIILKESPKYVPVFGTAMYLFEFIFLKRRWEQDREQMKHYLQNIHNKHLWLVLFPEGTILAEDTIEKSKIHCQKLNKVLVIHLELTKADIIT